MFDGALLDCVFEYWSISMSLVKVVVLCPLLASAVVVVVFLQVDGRHSIKDASTL